MGVVTIGCVLERLRAEYGLRWEHRDGAIYRFKGRGRGVKEDRPTIEECAAVVAHLVLKEGETLPAEWSDTAVAARVFGRKGARAKDPERAREVARANGRLGGRPPRINWAAVRFGEESDRAIAINLGCHPSLVGRERKRRGIAPSGAHSSD